ncbi:unnamed protein product [Blepharisma stoltei]|uniref:Uncharacterized protein n=1 Tax=Blepharisma stoltei TaxID=1481888 RepID=A0AAU9JRP9_9CILI|nr:unnamed protein product [Blepharisma stoltei]
MSLFPISLFTRQRTIESKGNRPRMLSSQGGGGDAYQKIQDLQEQLNIERTKNIQLQAHLQQAERSLAQKVIDYQTTIAALKAELKETRMGPSPNSERTKSSLEQVDSLHRKLMIAISSFKKDMQNELLDQEKDIVRIFDMKLGRICEDLEEKRQKKVEEISSLVKNEGKISKELEMLRSSAQIIDSKNLSLEQENKQLKIELKIKESELRELMEKYYRVKKQYENEEEKFEMTGTMRSVFTANSPKSVTRQIETALTINNPQIERYEGVIARLKKLLEIERKNLRAARTAYTREIESKTEVEMILRKCIENVRNEIIKKRGMYKKSEAEEREMVVEHLLNSEEVLTSIYDKAFPRSNGSL